ncbi:MULTISPECIES: hypothetical protein [Mycolicibacterium]|uniref:hypothetical protein n=1 Tax=Mycolicibacterium TaxID=1866885 RepID=UPI0026035BDC|nr:hypothetical protein [Mycolicibacterium fortuitum]
MTRDDVIAAAAERMQAQLERVTDVADLTERERDSLPDWWTELITAEPPEAVRLTVSQWYRQLSQPLLPRFLGVLTERGIDVALVRVASTRHTGLALLYSVRYSDALDRYVCGLPPTVALADEATKLPGSFPEFYTTIHAGMYFQLNNAHALVKPDELITWREWSYEEEIAFLFDPPSFVPNSESLYIVFNDCGGAMVLVDTDPADPGVWAVDVGMLDDRAHQYRSTWELLDDWISGWFTPI